MISHMGLSIVQPPKYGQALLILLKKKIHSQTTRQTFYQTCKRLTGDLRNQLNQTKI